MNDENVVEVTGVGAVSPLGRNVSEFWQGLLAGWTGLTPCSPAQAEAGTALVGAATLQPQPHYRRINRHARTINRTFALLLDAAEQCVQDACLDRRPVADHRTAVVIGIGALDSYVDLRALLETPMPAGTDLIDRLRTEVDPMRRLRHLPNIGASLVSIEHRAAGPALTLVGGHASGLMAVLEAGALIREGVADVAICGAADARLDPALLAQFGATTCLSKLAKPAEACRPFHPQGTGVVASEGAAMLVLEHRSSARARDVKSYAQLSGGFTAGSALAPAVEGIVQRTVALASPTDVGAVIAHGDGTATLDHVEETVLRSVFARLASRPAVTSIKGHIGHTMSAAGAFNAITACLAIRHGVLPALSVRPNVDLPFVTGSPKELTRPLVLANALDARGAAASALFTAEAR